MKRFAFAVLVAVSLFRCAFAPDYEAPASGEVARIEFVNDTSTKERVLLYGDAAECRNQSILTPSLAPGASITATVAADRDLAFTTDRVIGDKICMSTRSFHPEAGKTYVMHFQAVADGCSVFGTEGQRPVALAKRNWIRPFDESGSFCTPLQ
jgi:hypothetical protein